MLLMGIVIMKTATLSVENENNQHADETSLKYTKLINGLAKKLNVDENDLIAISKSIQGKVKEYNTIRHITRV
jgi:hypothetical protein